MELKKIDRVLPQPLQTGFARLRNVLTGPVLRALTVAYAVARLGRHELIIPVRPQRFPQNLLAAAIAVDVRYVEEVDPQIARAMNGDKVRRIQNIAPATMSSS